MREELLNEDPSRGDQVRWETQSGNDSREAIQYECIDSGSASTEENETGDQAKELSPVRVDPAEDLSGQSPHKEWLRQMLHQIPAKTDDRDALADE